MPIRVTPRPRPLWAGLAERGRLIPGDPPLGPEGCLAEAKALVRALRAGWGAGGRQAFFLPEANVWLPGILGITFAPPDAPSVTNRSFLVAVGWFREGDRERVAAEILAALGAEGIVPGKGTPDPSPGDLSGFAAFARENGSPGVRATMGRLGAVASMLGMPFGAGEGEEEDRR